MPRKPALKSAPQLEGDFLSDDFLKQLNNQFPVVKAARPSETVEWFDVEELDTNPFQPRESYDESKLEEMVLSLNQFGMLQAVLARPHPTREGRLQLIAGHRRREAIRRGANAGPLSAPNREQYAGKMPVRVVKNVSDVAMLTLAIEENEARHDLSPIERGKSYRQLKELVATSSGKGNDDGSNNGATTWADVEKVTGLSYRHMKRLSDLLDLPANAVDLIRQGEWTERHGRAILSLNDAPKLRDQLVRQMIKEKLSARAADLRAKELRSAQATSSESKNKGAVGESGQQETVDEQAGKSSHGASSGGLNGSGASDNSGGSNAGISVSRPSETTASNEGTQNIPPHQSVVNVDESPLAQRLGAALAHVSGAITEVDAEQFKGRGGVFELLEKARAQLNDALLQETKDGFTDSSSYSSNTKQSYTCDRTDANTFCE